MLFLYHTLLARPPRRLREFRIRRALRRRHAGRRRWQRVERIRRRLQRYVIRRRVVRSHRHRLLGPCGLLQRLLQGHGQRLHPGNSDGYSCHTNADCCASDCAHGICGGPKDAAAFVEGSADGETGGLVLCGGDQFIATPPFPQTTFGDSWVFDGSTWIQRTAMNAPCGSENGAAAALPTEAAVAFRGGYYVNGSSSYVGGGTETFAGTNWNTRTAKTTDPVARMGHAMASLGSVVVLFGGNTVTNSGGAFLQETWTFDGSNWILLTTANAPSGRSGHAMATLGSKVILFGGADATGLQERHVDVQWRDVDAREYREWPPQRGGMAQWPHWTAGCSSSAATLT